VRWGAAIRLALATALCACALTGSPASAAADPPTVEASWVTEVTATSANLRAQINPNAHVSNYRFEYISEAAYQANLQAAPPREAFSGAAKAPTGAAPGLGGGASPITVVQHLGALSPVTAYHYRAVATSSEGSTVGPEHVLVTEEPTNVFSLLDRRGWEMVSPVDKNGGAIQGFGQNFGGGVLQAAADGSRFTYSSADSFGAEPEGAPAASQYLAARGPGGWSSANITTPLLAGSYGDSPTGVPYQLFSPDLARGLLSNGERCRGLDGECPVANPPLPGSGAPAGFRDYYLRDNGSGGFGALVKAPELTQTSLDATQFELRFVGSSPDLTHTILSTCAALTANATEVPAPGGCSAAAQNLYQWSAAGLALINLLPLDIEGTPGAVLAAQSGAVSNTGARVYFVELEDSALYLREQGGPTKLVPETAGGGAAFQTASSDGHLAFFTKGGHLHRYDSTSGTSTDLTPAGGVQGVLGASADGSSVYYVAATGLFLWRNGVTGKVAAGAAASNYPPATGTARVTPDGSHLAFLSAAELTGYENNGVTEVFLYGPPPAGGAAKLVCVSCNPTGERPAGASTILGAVANGNGGGVTRSYKPRSLSDDGSRVFFDSADVLAVSDSNNRPDVYEWEAPGAGTCAREFGCVGLISSGRSGAASTFIDASADGSDAFFLTDSSLYPPDPGSLDVYDARIDGGFRPPETPIPCEGDSCQALPPAPEDPTPGTLVPNSGNPPLQIAPAKKNRKTHHRKKHKKRKLGEKRKHGQGGKR
jgi:hypothetical protein